MLKIAHIETGIVNADYANGGCFCLYACAMCGIGKQPQPKADSLGKGGLASATPYY